MRINLGRFVHILLAGLVSGILLLQSGASWAARDSAWRSPTAGVGAAGAIGEGPSQPLALLGDGQPFVPDDIIVVSQRFF